MVKRLYLMCLLLLPIVLIFLLSCFNQNPIKSNPPPDGETSYDFYIYAHLNDINNIYIYNTSEMNINDSFPAGEFRDISVTADASHFLYTTNHPYITPDTLVIIKLPDLDTVRVLPIDGYLETSQMGNYIAVQGDSLVFLDGHSFDVIFTDTVKIESGRFLNDNKFYSIYNGNKIRIYDMVGESLYTQIDYRVDTLPPHQILNLQPVGNGEVIYMTVRTRKTFVISYFPEKDSVGLWYSLTGSGGGDLGVSPDGFQVVVTDPDDAIGNIGSHNIVFFDPGTDDIISIIDCDEAFEDNSPLPFNPYIISFTPDSKYMLVLNKGSRMGLIDIAQHSFVDIEIYDNSIGFWDVAAQKR